MVDVQEVRDALDEIPEDELSDSAIEQAISYAEAIVQYNAGHGDSEVYSTAIVQVAAWRAFNSLPPKDQMSALDVEDSWEVSEYEEALREAADNAIQAAGGRFKVFEVF